MRLYDYTCPWCGCKEMVYGKQDASASIKPLKTDFPVGLKMQTITHIICKQCGTIIRSYVENTDLLTKGEKI